MTQKVESCILYHHIYSVCSMYVRYAYEIAGEPRDPSSSLEIKEESVDMFHSAQLDENFLCDVNPKGQIPVLVPESTGKPIADSLKITYFLGDHYPSLFPSAHREEITKLLEALHSISLYAISFRDKPQLPQGFVTAIKDRMKPGISDRYRDALNYKLSVTTDKNAALEPTAAAENETRLKDLMTTFDSHLSESLPWMFGLPHPSALDAHLVIFLTRLQDAKRFDLVPVGVQRYAEAAQETDAYKIVMGGRRTFPGI